jgi:adenylate cyclase
MAKILVVDDDAFNRDLLQQELADDGHILETAADGEEALAKADQFLPDVILLDQMMPRMDGIEVVKRLKADDRLRAIPVIMVTGRGAQEDKVRGLEAGADDYVVKPVDTIELRARVRSMLRIKEMHDALEESRRTLATRVQEQVGEIERIARLKRYLSPQVAEAILRTDEDSLFAGHRREITVVFLDLRGFTAFSDSAEPEEVLEVLRGYHKAMGRIIFAYEGTVERFTGDGIMIFFNDPVPTSDHSERAVRMALEMQRAVGDLQVDWSKQGYDLAQGIGLVTGYATLGEVGFEGRRDYAAIGNVTNLAARLSSAAGGGQTYTDRKTAAKLEHLIETEYVEDMSLKGLVRPVAVFSITGLKG